MLPEGDQHTLQEESKLSAYRHMRMAVPWVLANATPEEEASPGEHTPVVDHRRTMA